MDWTYLNIEDFHNRVRSVLNSITPSTLTDAQIDMPEKAPLAERYIKSVVSNWETLYVEEPDKFKLFESCIVYKTAIDFQVYVQQKQPKRMQTSSLNVEYSTSGNIKDVWEMTLTDKLNELLAELLPTSEIFHGFRVTEG